MTKKSIVTLALISLFTLAQTAHAADNRRGSPPPTTSSSSSYSDSYSSGGSSTFSLGFSTGSLAVNAQGTQALAALIGLRGGDFIDIRFTMPATSPFNFGMGAFYKHTINNKGSSGFHLGGGFALGDVNAGAGGNFALAFAGLIGFHFTIPGVSAVSMHFDGGPAFTLVTSDPSVTNFAINPFSGVLGASIYYTF